jgi:hypothetical protein
MQPLVLPFVATLALVCVSMRFPDVVLTGAVFVVLAVRPFLDAFSERRLGLGPLTGNASVVVGLGVLIVGGVVWVSRARRGLPAWPERRLLRAHALLLAAYGIGFISAWREGGITGAEVALRELLRVGGVVSSFLVVWWWVDSDRFRRQWGWTLVWLAALGQLLIGYSQLFTSRGLLQEATGLDRVQGSFSHPNTLGIYLVPLILITFSRLRASEWRLGFWRIVLMVGLVGLLGATYSRGSIIALVAGFVVFLALRTRRIRIPQLLQSLLIVSAVGALVWLVGGTYVRERFSTVALNAEALEAARAGAATDSFGWRLINWITLVQLGMGHAVMGHGTGMTTVLNPLINADTGLPFNAHNDFVRFFFETGVIGLLLYSSYAVLLCSSVIKWARGLGHEERPVGVAVAAAWVSLLLLTAGAMELSLQTAVLWQLYGMTALGWRSFEREASTRERLVGGDGSRISTGLRP